MSVKNIAKFSVLFLFFGVIAMVGVNFFLYNIPISWNIIGGWERICLWGDCSFEYSGKTPLIERGIYRDGETFEKLSTERVSGDTTSATLLYVRRSKSDRMIIQADWNNTAINDMGIIDANINGKGMGLRMSIDSNAFNVDDNVSVGLYDVGGGKSEKIELNVEINNSAQEKGEN